MSHTTHGYKRTLSPISFCHVAGETTLDGPNLATIPCLSFSRDSISAVDAPRCRSTNIFLRVATSRNSLPWLPDLPRFSNSLSAFAWIWRLAWSAPSVALVEAGGNCGGEKEDRAGENPSGNEGVAVDDGEKIGFGWATPIFLRRSANAGFTESKPEGSIDSAWIDMSASSLWWSCLRGPLRSSRIPSVLGELRSSLTIAFWK